MLVPARDHSEGQVTLTLTDIVSGLRSMGLKAGDKVMVHSSLSSMGRVEGGAPTVVQSFVDVIGTQGTLMVPTFTHSNTEYFDPLTSPSKNGAITEAARLFSKAVTGRAMEPVTGSFMVR